jgi:hypothetical protein
VTQRYRYPLGAVIIEVMQGAAGFALTVGVLRFAQPAGLLIWVLAAAAGLFLVYFARAVVRYLTRFELDERGIRALGPQARDIAWPNLRGLRLDHYTTRSDRSGGWMQLVVRGARGSIRIDSSLEGFDRLAVALAEEATRSGCPFDASTRANYRALGFTPHD